MKADCRTALTHTLLLCCAFFAALSLPGCSPAETTSESDSSFDLHTSPTAAPSEAPPLEAPLWEAPSSAAPAPGETSPGASPPAASPPASLPAQNPEGAPPSPRDYAASELVSEAVLEELGYRAFFYESELDEDILRRIGGSSLPDPCPLDAGELRYLRLLHRDLSGDARVGEMICHRAISEDLLFIFSRLYLADYPIEQIRLVDDFNAKDEVSGNANNTSCFNYRMSTSGNSLSQHAYGAAVDINPLYNPYVLSHGDQIIRISPEGGLSYADRSLDFPYKIEEGDLCVRLFTERGFSWGGSWKSVKDYMHFQKPLPQP